MSIEETSTERPRLLRWSKRLGDAGLGAAVIAVVVMMVVPLTPWLIDLLIASNLGFSVLLLSLALFIAKPLSFTVFPTLLLVATLFRLALNISSTRLILIQADAGRIIGAFGGYVVGGDIVIGAVIFGILAMVLFLVITKGAERVAEVAARFSLDALPGMQLAIDSDLRLGALSQREAVRRREMLDEQSRYYGALDGAMKFVRGDAIAGLVIIAVNILGGIMVGTLRHGLSIGQAVDTYGRLTVGDGLVSMIPALLISTAAGLLVTRVGERGRDFRLGEQVSRQLLSEPRALVAATVLLIGLACVRGLPAWPFLGLALVFGVAALKRFVSERRHPKTDIAVDDVATRLGGSATRVEMGPGLFRELSYKVAAGPSLRHYSTEIAETLRNTYGLPILTVSFVENETAPDRELILKIRGGISHRMVIPKRAAFCRASLSALKRVGVSSLAAAGVNGHWISTDDVSLVVAAGMSVTSPLAAVSFLVSEWLSRSLARLIGVDETQVLVDRVAVDRPVLVRETMPKRIDLPTLSGLLGKLAEEGVHLDLLPEILEAVGRGPAGVSQEDLVERVRVGLAPAITAELCVSGEPLRVLLLDESVASVLASGLIKTEQGTGLALPAEDISLILQALRHASDKAETSILVTNANLRRPLADLLRVELPDIKVLKTTEIDPLVRPEVVAEVTI